MPLISALDFDVRVPMQLLYVIPGFVLYLIGMTPTIDSVLQRHEWFSRTQT